MKKTDRNSNYMDIEEQIKKTFGFEDNVEEDYGDDIVPF